jgi:hypothetical protein
MSDLEQLASLLSSMATNAVNEVARSKGISLRFKSGRVQTHPDHYRVFIAPVRPVSRRIPQYDLLAEAEMLLHERCPGLRVNLAYDEPAKASEELVAGRRGAKRVPRSASQSKGNRMASGRRKRQGK